RGYGRTGAATHRSRRLTGALMLTGMCGLCLGAYGLLDGSGAGSLGFPGLLAGAVLCGAGLVVGSRRVRRTQYRPDPWRLPEWVVVLAGAVPAAVFIAEATVASLNPSTQPLVWPTLPIVPALAVLFAAVPAVAAPPPLRPVRRARTAADGADDADSADDAAAAGPPTSPTAEPGRPGRATPAPPVEVPA
ncbi:MAG TPA: hypothetical protein VGG23_02550, partial [Acidimicrobiales bacterium]